MLFQELARLRGELSLAESDAVAEEQRIAKAEAVTVAAAVRAETEASARELEMRASIAAQRELLATRQREAADLRAMLDEQERLESQAAELRSKLVSAKAWQLHRQLVSAQRDGKAALDALEAEVAAAATERQHLDAELVALSADRDRLLVELTNCTQSKQAAANQLLTAKRDLAFATLDSEAAQARAARVRLSHSVAVLENSHPTDSLPSLAVTDTGHAVPDLEPSPPVTTTTRAPLGSGRLEEVGLLSSVEAESAATLAEMRSLLLSLQGHAAIGNSVISTGSSPRGQQDRLPSEAELAESL